MELAAPECPVYVDTLDNKVSSAYGSNPERIVAILNNEIVYLGEPGPFAYDIEGFGKWLNKFVGLIWM